MLLFSTILEIDKKLTKDNFINLVIEWNQKGHPEVLYQALSGMVKEIFAMKMRINAQKFKNTEIKI